VSQTTATGTVAPLSFPTNKDNPILYEAKSDTQKWSSAMLADIFKDRYYPAYYDAKTDGYSSLTFPYHIITDSDYSQEELNEDNNSITCYIQTLPPYPDMTFSGPVTITPAGALTPNNPIKLGCTLKNQSFWDLTDTHTLKLEVRKGKTLLYSTKYTPSRSQPLKQGGTLAIPAFSIGTLSKGTHQIVLTATVEGYSYRLKKRVSREANSADNTTTVTIKVTKDAGAENWNLYEARREQQSADPDRRPHRSGPDPGDRTRGRSPLN
jgi:hypothetical protein